MRLAWLLAVVVAVAFAASTAQAGNVGFRWYGETWGTYEGQAFVAALNKHGADANQFKKNHPDLAALFEQPWPDKLGADLKIAKRLDTVFARYAVPLAGTGGAFVDAGKQWRVSPFYIAAIAGVESTFGREACDHNPFGILACAKTFGSWADSIQYTSRLIRVGYIDQGYATPYAIGARYCPPCGTGHGAETVRIMRLVFGAGPGVLYKHAIKAVK